MYNASLKYKWDNKNVRDYAAEQGREQGLQQGLQQGLEQGLQQGREEGRTKAEAEKKEVARNLKNKGIDLKIISDATGLSIEDIEAL